MIDQIRAIQERAERIRDGFSLFHGINEPDFTHLLREDIPWLCDLALAYRDRMRELAKALGAIADNALVEHPAWTARYALEDWSWVDNDNAPQWYIDEALAHPPSKESDG